jgi:hypothetical protein
MIEAVLAWLALAGVAAGVLLAYRARRIGVAVGLLFAAASFSRITAPLGPYSVRLEQPALIVLIGLVLVGQRGSIRRVVTGHPWLIAAAGLYLAANLVSSALYAPRPLDSLRIAGWLGLSMVGGLAVAALAARTPQIGRAVPGWIVGAASIQVGVGLVAVVSEAVFHTTWGVQATDVVLGKTFALSWEANVMAINLAMAVPFLLVPGSGLRLGDGGRLAAAAWLGFGIGLAYSRGGALGLLAAAVLVGGLVAWTARADPLPALRRYLGPVLRVGALAFAAAFLTVGALDVLASRGVGWTSSAVVVGQTPVPHTPGPVVGSPGPSASAVGPGPSPAAGSPAPTAPATPAPTPIFVGTGDTLAVRMNNIGIALRELPRSPLVGLGTDSFQQQHIEPSGRGPAAISNLLVGALYDSGILGLVGLAGFLLGVLHLAWRRGEWAYLMSLLAMVIAYQATDAFRFASNWIVMGLVIGIATHTRSLSGTAALATLGGSGPPREPDQ